MADRGFYVGTEFDASTDGFERGVSRIERRLQTFQQGADRKLSRLDRRVASAGKSFRTMGREIGGATRMMRAHVLAIGAATAGFTLLIRNSFAYAESVADAAAKTGVAITSLQELQFAADQNGASARDMTDALTRLQRRVGLFIQNGGGPAKVGMEALGLTVDDVTTKFVGTEAVFIEMTRRLSELGSQAEISAVASAFLGDDAGPRLAALLAQGEAGLESYREEARRLGLVMSEELVEEAGIVNARMRALGNTLSRQVMTAVVDLAPEISDLADSFEKALPAITNLIGFAIKALEIVGNIVGAIYDGITRLRRAIGVEVDDRATRVDAEVANPDTTRDRLNELLREQSARIAEMEAARVSYAELNDGRPDIFAHVNDGLLRSAIERRDRIISRLTGGIFSSDDPLTGRVFGAESAWPPPAATIDAIEPPAFDDLGAGAGAGAGRSFEDVLDGSRERTIALSQEANALGLAGEELSYYTERMRLLNEVSELGVGITDEQLGLVDEQARRYAAAAEQVENRRAAAELLQQTQEAALTQEQRLADEIERINGLRGELVSLLGDEAAAHRIVEQAIEQATDRLGEMNAAQNDAFKGLARNILDAIRRGEEFDAVLAMIADRLSEMAFESAWTLIDGGSTSSAGGSFFDLIGDMFRADGGPVRAGQPYIVGERQPELFVPSTNGVILPEVPSPPVLPAASAGGGSVTLAPVVNVTVEGGDDPEADGEAVGRVVVSIVQNELLEQSRQGGLLWNMANGKR